MASITRCSLLFILVLLLDGLSLPFLLDDIEAHACVVVGKELRTCLRVHVEIGVRCALAYAWTEET